MKIDKGHLEYLRYQAKQKFEPVRQSMTECGRWAAPHRVKWLLSQIQGERNNYHIVDPSHLLALRSFVAGFLEGNTSAARPWIRQQAQSPEANKVEENKEWLELFTRRILNALSTSNFYHSAGQTYEDYGTFNTACNWIDELPTRLYFHNPPPGAFYPINNAWGDVVVLVQEKCLNVKALVNQYGRKDKNGNWNWSNFSSRVKKLYEMCNYTVMIEIVQIAYENEDFDPMKPMGKYNRRWLSITYELGGSQGPYYADGMEPVTSPEDANVYLEIKASNRKPFIVARGPTSGNFEYGEKGPTLDALGLIKSLNKKAISKDQALEQMLRPPLQGPANLKKSYVTSAPNSYVPIDALNMAKNQGLRTIFEVNPAIAPLLQDVSDMRQQVDKIYYADYLMYLSRNPKTRTATETTAIVQEQQLIIGPSLQSLDFTFNNPVVDYVAQYVLEKDPYLPPPPPGLAGQFLKTEFISVFAQAQKSADLPSVERYLAAVMNMASVDPGVLQKANFDKACDIYEDRLYLPAGLNNPQSKVDAQRKMMQAQMERQQALQETLPAVAGAVKDLQGAKQQAS